MLRYVSPITGRRRNAGLGSYPEVSVADAGNQARLMREQLSKGLDPLDEVS
ncbi:Arm DNA-binding domain-containing protein [Aeromonas veronii]|uniref:Arm DNA-binding domain-containing protein n=1 Tax=Aeromonas veronii TaxID=654 RepID=UPI002A74B4E8|nr:Arm DNA-binding domain-containing protein [Aeromonas veronii]